MVSTNMTWTCVGSLSFAWFIILQPINVKVKSAATFRSKQLFKYENQGDFMFN